MSIVQCYKTTNPIQGVLTLITEQSFLDKRIRVFGTPEDPLFLDLKEYSQKLAPVEKLILLNYFRQMLQKMILMQEYKEKMEQLRTQVEEVYADDEEMIEFIEKRNKRTAKEKAREKALAKIREAESEEKTKK